MTNLKKVLIIEDDNDVRIITETSLKGVDSIEVTSASDGKKGLEMLSASVPDLVLLDIMMPVLDGFAVHKKMREIDLLKKVPVIFITAKDQESVDSYMKQMDDPYLLGVIFKPFDVALLSRQILDMWDQHTKTH